MPVSVIHTVPWPTGTTVGFYPGADLPPGQIGAPPGTLAGTADVAEDGTLTTPDLDAGDYVAAATIDSVWRYVRVHIGEVFSTLDQLTQEVADLTLDLGSLSDDVTNLSNDLDQLAADVADLGSATQPTFPSLEASGFSYVAAGTDGSATSRLAGLVGAYEVNNAWGGASIGRELSGTSRGYEIVQRGYDRTRSQDIALSSLVFFQFGMGDLLNGTGSESMNAWKNGFRAGLARIRCARCYEDTDATFGYTGSWSTTSTTLHNSGTGYHTSTSGSSVATITLPDNFRSGTTVYICFIVNHSTGTSTATYGGTAGVTGTTNLTGSANALTGFHVPVVKRIPNLVADAGDTITITRTTGTVSIDWWGYEAITPPVILAPRLNKLEEWAGIFSGITDADIVTWNAEHVAMCAEFDSTGNEVISVEIDSVLNGQGDAGPSAVQNPNFGTDQIHPSELGHELLAERYYSELQSRIDQSATNKVARSVNKAKSIHGLIYTTQGRVLINNSIAAVKFDQPKFAGTGWYGPGAAVDQRIYCFEPGLYHIGASVVIGNQATSGRRYAEIRINSTTPALAREDATPAGGSVFFTNTPSPHIIHELKYGDYIEVWAYQNGVGASTTVTDNPLTSGATTINLASTTGMSAGDFLQIEDEVVQIGTVASGTELTGCTRAALDTTADSHVQTTAAKSGLPLYYEGGSSTFPPCVLWVYRIGIL